MEDPINKLEEDLKRKKISSSHLIAERIIQIFDRFLRMEDAWKTPADLLSEVKKMGNRLRDADRLNFVVPNTVKRVLHILRESCKILNIE